MRTVRLIGTLLAALTLVIGGCALFEPEPDGTFSVVIAGRDPIDPYPVDVVDRTGTVTAVVVGEGNFQEGVEAAPADPAILIVTWMGSACDTRTTLALDPTIDSIRISETTHTRPGACRAMGVMRSIAIRFDPPLAPALVEIG